jgi:hypothetical protein
MREEWRPIADFPGYEVSSLGRVRSYWRSEKKTGCWGGLERILCDEPTKILRQSDDGNGYLKVYLHRPDGYRRCVKVHRLVAEAFIPNYEGYDTVDHIQSGRMGKYDNSVSNLRWISRRDNIIKAYEDGMCNERIRHQRKLIVLEDTWTGEELAFESIGDAARFLRLAPSTISHAISSSSIIAGRYYADFPIGKDRLLYEPINVYRGERRFGD